MFQPMFLDVSSHSCQYFNRFSTQVFEEDNVNILILKLLKYLAHLNYLVKPAVANPGP